MYVNNFKQLKNLYRLFPQKNQEKNCICPFLKWTGSSQQGPRKSCHAICPASSKAACNTFHSRLDCALVFKLQRFWLHSPQLRRNRSSGPHRRARRPSCRAPTSAHGAPPGGPPEQSPSPSPFPSPAATIPWKSKLAPLQSTHASSLSAQIFPFLQRSRDLQF